MCFRPYVVIGIRILACCGFLLGACSHNPEPASDSSAQRPVASLQELMVGIVDPAADSVWNSVETIVTAGGTTLHQPRSDDEWAATRRAALTLSEAGNLLMMSDRQVGVAYFPAEAPGALDSTAISRRILTQRQEFLAYAGALRLAGRAALDAIDRKDAEGLTRAGGAVDAVCEGCHRTFWYPDQVIPLLPFR